MTPTGGILPPFFMVPLFLFQGCSRTDLFRHQGYPAPPSLVSVL